jgi:HKD family nuclease
MFYSQPLSRRFGTDLIALLSSGEWTHVDMAVAWVRESGLRHIQHALTSFIKNKGVLRVVVGIDLDNTSKEGLAALLALEPFGAVSTFVNHNESGSVFHPKLYLFRNAAASKLIVGSNNITEAGFYRNTEAGLEVNGKAGDQLVMDTIAAVDNWCDTTSGLARRLDPNLLLQLETSGYISTETMLRAAASQRRAAARKSGTPNLFGSVPYAAPVVLGASPTVSKTAAASSKKPSGRKSAQQTPLQPTTGGVLIMRIRTARGTQTQMPKDVIASTFFNGVTTVRSVHDGKARDVHEAKAGGKRNTLKLEIPETKKMTDPMVRFEKLPSGIHYHVWDKSSSQGKAIWSSLQAGRTSNPPSTFLTKPSSPTQSTWWRFI